MPARTWITISFPTLLFFCYHLPLIKSCIINNLNNNSPSASRVSGFQGSHHLLAWPTRSAGCRLSCSRAPPTPKCGSRAQIRHSPTPQYEIALIKKKIKFSSYMRKFRVEQLQSHIWLTASSYMWKYFCISSYIRKPFLCRGGYFLLPYNE